MQVLVEEYGMLVIACVCASLFMVIIHMLLFGDKNIVTTYNSDIVNVKIYSSDVAGAVLQYSPHFEASDDINDYKIPDRTFTKDMALNIVDIWNDDGCTSRYGGEVTILVTRYDLVMTKWLDPSGEPSEAGPSIPEADAITAGWTYLANPVPIYTKVEKTDKYGNRIWQVDGSGKPLIWQEGDPDQATFDSIANVITDKWGIKHKVGERKAEYVDVLKFHEQYLGEMLGRDLTAEEQAKVDAGEAAYIKEIYIKDEDFTYGMPPRYKLVYRVELGSKKAEFTTLLIKDNN